MEIFHDNGEESHNMVTGIGLSYLIDLIIYDIIDRRCALMFFILYTHIQVHKYRTDYVHI
jgi:hypothetical protein